MVRPTPSLCSASDFIPGTEPGQWRQDPISQIPLALGAHWGDVTPLVIRSGATVSRAAAAQPAHAAYAEAYAEVQRLGGDGITTRTERTDRADDGRPVLGV